MRLDGKTVAVVGLGASGLGAARLAMKLGARVLAVDGRAVADVPDGVDLTVGEAWEPVLDRADVVVVSPGVPAAHGAVQAAVARGADVVGELGFASRYVSAPVIAVTGTNGKSTVTRFTADLLSAAGLRAFAGGNLGTPLSVEALAPSADVCVVEVSSYQLELPGQLAPIAGAILNLTPDHLGRHGTMQGYAEAKAKLLDGMPAGAPVYIDPSSAPLREACASRGHVRQLAIGALPGVKRQGRLAKVEGPRGSWELDLSGVQVPGAHNLDHAATAAALALAAGADVQAVHAGLPQLRSLPHRMQPVGERDGVVWIDDSKATNLASTRVAIEGLEKRAVVLLGGQAKGPGFSELVGALARHRAVVTFGGSGPMIAAELRQAGLQPVEAGTMEQGLESAAALARAGDVVLLSPGCASFDAFNNFEHRGRVFAAWVRNGERS